MSEAKAFYEKFKQTFVSWAQSTDDIRAAFMVGSRARKDHVADEWSDMDIIMYTRNPEKYLAKQDWLKELGDVRTSFVYQTAGGDPECLTLFEDGRQVDFVVHGMDKLEYIVQNRITPDNFYRGVKVLVDKEHIADCILPDGVYAPEEGNRVTEEAFQTAVNMFWFVALYTAKQILRNELWVVKERDHDMKGLLLQMTEWHEKTVHGEDYDTWHAGRFLYEWAGKETLDELKNTFGHYNKEDSWKALSATISLFQRLSHDVAQRKKFDYPDELEHCVMEWIHNY